MAKSWTYTELTVGAAEILGDAPQLEITRPVVLPPAVRATRAAPLNTDHVQPAKPAPAYQTVRERRLARIAACTKERLYAGQLFRGWGEMNMLVASGGVMYAKLCGLEACAVSVGYVVDVDCRHGRSRRSAAISYVYRDAVEAVFGPGIDLAGYGYVGFWAAGSRYGAWYPQGDDIFADIDPPARPRKPRVRNRPFNPIKGGT